MRWESGGYADEGGHRSAAADEDADAATNDYTADDDEADEYAQADDDSADDHETEYHAGAADYGADDEYKAAGYEHAGPWEWVQVEALGPVRGQRLEGMHGL